MVLFYCCLLALVIVRATRAASIAAFRLAWAVLALAVGVAPLALPVVAAIAPDRPVAILATGALTAVAMSAMVAHRRERRIQFASCEEAFFRTTGGWSDPVAARRAALNFRGDFGAVPFRAGLVTLTLLEAQRRFLVSVLRLPKEEYSQWARS